MMDDERSDPLIGRRSRGMSGDLVLLTGASTGIGYATTLYLADAGFRVLAGVRSEEAAERLVEAGGASVIPLTLDVTKPDDLETAAEAIERENGGKLDGLVNNAGVFYPNAAEVAPLEEYRRTMEVNFFGLVALTQRLIPALRKAQGRIVNVSSMNGRVAMPLTGSYAASKFAVEAFSDALRVELASSGIHVIVVQPGQIRTEIFGKAMEAMENPGLAADLGELYGSLYETGMELLDQGKNTLNPPENVARAIQAALNDDPPRTRYAVGEDTAGFFEMQAKLSDREMDQQLAEIFGLVEGEQTGWAG
jgi:NAD(P)-dependent dehydrogenase (short-subunit alcohol dehydrogenase family)